ncbi:ATP-dependent zinc protease [Amphritea sp.]|uniref:ATP-dependent zinc protease family protein n=1 Tax=Amphritea sp. TaxID=1872502 RepID=UPI0025B8AFA8|nr:ATP-dependent zinc protease [Amphritea sp.]
MNNKMIIGNIENCDLPDLGIFDLQVRIDTGAKTSSLHVDNLSRYKKAGKPWVKFEIHPNIHKVAEVVECNAPIQDIRRIKSSNGTVEERYVIKTMVSLGQESWSIEITLTDRSDMSYLMLFGREGMGDKVLVDPSATFLLTDYS